MSLTVGVAIALVVLVLALLLILLGRLELVVGLLVGALALARLLP
jgi:hypothetical protein